MAEELRHAHTIRLAGVPDIDAVSSMLARSFDDDPVWRYVLPSERLRGGGLEAYIAIQLRTDYLAFGSVWTTDRLEGAALWAPPGEPMRTGLSAIIPILPLLRYAGARGAWRSIALLSAVEELHPKVPHWYLSVLGTDPPHQRRGIASALMAPALRRCDEGGFGAYLESSKERNLAFYNRHGFEVTNEIARRGAPTVWTMWREPRPAEP